MKKMLDVVDYIKLLSSKGALVKYKIITKLNYLIR